MRKKILFLGILLFLQVGFGQQLVLKKGKIVDSLKINDSIPETFSLYLPKDFDTKKNWPLLLVMASEETQKKTLSRFASSGEKQGYITASVRMEDTLSLAKNMAKVGGVLKRVSEILPIEKSRVYVAGNGAGANYASLTPLFINIINGVVAIGKSVSNTDVLNSKRPFHFIGIVGKNSYQYTNMLATEKVLNRLGFPSQVLVYNEDKASPDIALIDKALQIFTLRAMGRKLIPKDNSFIENAYANDLQKVNAFRSQQQMLSAEQYIGEMFSIYRLHKNLDSLRIVQKDIRKNKIYKAMRRAENAAFFKESLLKDDYIYYMEEDVQTHNFNNLGWWNYQMDELDKFIEGSSVFEKQMGNRLKDFVNDLAEDNIDLVQSDKLVDEDALAFLYMLKTLTEPDNFNFYLKIISLSAKNEDYGTSLFYLEEALKKGFKDTDKLYALEHTTLLRINPNFNALVAKYLKKARYDIIEE